ncbi:MAG: VWA domain-containing protein, partial [Planctomycetaceae bacterium]|nr:VWA domain-containing protein [Planctomycetaceae bacterium]
MKRSLKSLLALTALVALSAAGSVGYACFMRSPQPVQVWLDHITINITDQVASKTYDCTFKNPNPRAVVGGTCYMELEPGAQVDNMSVLVDGKEMKAEILDVEKAKEVFTDIVKNGGSPALLEYFGNQLIQTQVPRIAPGGVVKVKLTYTTVLKKRGDLIRLQMLNTNPKALMQPLKSASVTVNINSKEPIKNIYSPTHAINIVEKEGWDVAVEWKQENYMPKHPFVMYYQTTPEEVGASIVAHRELDEEGSFMMMLSPTIGQGAGKLTEANILPKDVVFCVDTSGSMLKDGKMEQARGALKYCVESLRDGDRFNIVDFSTVPRHFQEEGLVKVDDASRAKALRYVAKLHARGGTAINDALKLSLDHLGKDSDRLKMIVFATDGLPTIGERDPEAILKKIDKENTEDVRIFVFGEGFDVNTKLL